MFFLGAEQSGAAQGEGGDSLPHERGREQQ